MPLDRIVLWLLKGLRTLVLVWVGLLSFALLLGMTGLREAPGPSEFSELRQRLETRVSVSDTEPETRSEAGQPVRFDNFLVSVYLIPIFLVRWICGFGAYRRISPATILIGLFALALISAGIGGQLAQDIPGFGPNDPLSSLTIYASVFGALLAIPVLIAGALAVFTRRPQAALAWLLNIPGAVDRWLRHLFDPQSGGLATRIGHRIAFLSNGLLLAALAAPSAAAIWWACDWLDGRGVSLFALVVRAAAVALCIAMLVRAHLRSYRIGAPVSE